MIATFCVAMVTGDISLITNLISTIGFPIVCVCVLFWYIMKRDEKDAQETQSHKEEMDALRATLEKNTLVLQKLIDKIDSIGSEVKKDVDT